MSPLDKLLYGRFPRDAGVPRRFTLFNETHYNRFIDYNEGRRNVYCSIAWEVPGDGWYCDKVSLDFDTKLKVDGKLIHSRLTTPSNRSPIEQVREDPEMAEDVLGDVLTDVRAVARWAKEEDVPAVGVFTGYGVHVHLLYRPARDPRNQMLSTANYLEEELGFTTMDRKPVGDVARILRVPNCRRVVGENRRYAVDLYMLPLTREEMAHLHDPVALYDEARRPRSIPLDGLDVQSRPEMSIYEDYLVQTGYTAPQRTVEGPAPGVETDGELADWIRDLVKMPCIYERVLSANPHHEIRLNFAIKLFNIGYTPGEVHDIIRELNWRDYDPKETERQLNQIYHRKYGDWSCTKLKGAGFCTRLEDPTECPTFGWSGGLSHY